MPPHFCFRPAKFEILKLPPNSTPQSFPSMLPARYNRRHTKCAVSPFPLAPLLETSIAIFLWHIQPATVIHRVTAPFKALPVHHAPTQVPQISPTGGKSMGVPPGPRCCECESLCDSRRALMQFERGRGSPGPARPGVPL